MNTAVAGRGVLRVLLAFNAGMFAIEVAAGMLADSMGLVADGLDMGADALVYLLALLAVGGAASAKLRAARLAGWAQLGLAVVAMVEVLRRLVVGSAPEPAFMVAVSLVALIVNVTCLALLRRHREGEVHLQAAWIFSATDAQANLGVIAAGFLVAALESAVPDLVVGFVIAGLVLRGALRIRRRVAAAAVLGG